VNTPSIPKLCDLGLAMTPLVWAGLPQSIYNDRLTLPKAIPMLSSKLDQGDDKKTTLCEH
jgi:hypothetical protein